MILCFGIIILTCFFYSCDESFLDTQSTDTYNEANFWESENNAIAAINACYASLKANALYNNAINSMGMDNYTPNATMHGGNIIMVLGTRNNSNVDLFRDRWNADYGGIGRVNNLLGKIEAVPMDEPLKERTKAEAYFLRALFYHDLVMLYGGVPLITDPPSLEEHKDLPRDTKDAVIAQILIDLDNAASVLPESYGSSDIGRATKGAALGLKARVLLYEERWQEAAQTAKQVMDMGIYELFSDYRGLFLAENDVNDEVIFDVQFLHPDFSTSYDVILELQINSAPIPNLVNSYLMTDGLSMDESPLYDPAKPYDNRDPRLHQTVVVPGYLFRGDTVSETKYFSSGFGWKKYTSYKDDLVEPDYQYNSEMNFKILRYADILLMYAEAQNEAAGSDASVYAALNEIRQRAGMPDIQAGLSKDAMREVIRHERRIELAGEGLYYNDIRRWGIAEDVMNTTVYNRNGEVFMERVFVAPRDYLWPIHQETKEQNPALEQNPGY
jgi:hypothetical protein